MKCPKCGSNASEEGKLHDWCFCAQCDYAWTVNQQTRIDELKAVLRRLEWKGKDSSGYSACPECGGYGEPHNRHAPDCELNRVLEGK